MEKKGLHDIPEPYQGAITGTHLLCCNCLMVDNDQTKCKGRCGSHFC